MAVLFRRGRQEEVCCSGCFAFMCCASEQPGVGDRGRGKR